jgi:hypothetical protein
MRRRLENMLLLIKCGYVDDVNGGSWGLLWMEIFLSMC